MDQGVSHTPVRGVNTPTFVQHPRLQWERRDRGEGEGGGKGRGEKKGRKGTPRVG